MVKIVMLYGGRTRALKYLVDKCRLIAGAMIASACSRAAETQLHTGRHARLEERLWLRHEFK
jgi:hypothetical protein